MSVANLRGKLCHPRPRILGNPAAHSARFHQSRMMCREHGSFGAAGAGKIHWSPIDGNRRCASCNTARASGDNGVSWSNPILSTSPRHRTVPSSRLTSDHRKARMAPIRCPVSCASTRARPNNGGRRRSRRLGLVNDQTALAARGIDYINPSPAGASEQSPATRRTRRAPLQ